MRIVLFLIAKEFKQVFRDRALTFMLIAPPIVQLLIITSAATFEVKHVGVHLIDLDRTSASRRLVEQFEATGRFEVVSRSPSAAAADRNLLADDVGLILRIPAGFAEDLVLAGRADVQLILDGTDGPAAGVTQSYATQIIARFAGAEGARARTHPQNAHDARAPSISSPAAANARLPSNLAPPTSSPLAVIAASPPAPRLDIHIRTWYNPRRDYDDYMAPGILVILITIIGTMLTALNIAREKEAGTIEQLNVTPITKGQFITGKLVPFWLLGLAEFALGLFIAWLFYRIPFEGSLLLVFAGAALYLISALALGLLISTVSQTQQQAQFIAFFVLMIYLFISGLFTPVESMPDWAQLLAEANPIKHLIALVRAVLIKGAGTVQVAAELGALAAFAAVLLPLAVLSYRKTAS